MNLCIPPRLKEGIRSENNLLYGEPFVREYTDINFRFNLIWKLSFHCWFRHHHPDIAGLLSLHVRSD